MYKSETIAKLAEALSQAQAEIKGAEMKAVNPFLHNKYADLGSVIEAARPALAKHGLSFTQLVGGNFESMTLDTMLMHSSGEYIGEIISLPVSEEKGRSLAQSAGAIITYLRRYSLSALLGIYADEDTDAQQKKSQQEEEPANSKSPAAPQPPTNTQRPYQPEYLRDGLHKNAEKKYAGKIASQQQRGLLAGMLDEICAGDKDKRHSIQAFLFGAPSLNETRDSLVLAAFDWVKPTQDSGGAYLPDPMAARECEMIWTAALKAEGQQNLM